MTEPLVPRVVFDTNTVISALLFADGQLAWLRAHWRQGYCMPLISRATTSELTRVLAYPKFKLSPNARVELLGDYLPFCEAVEIGEKCSIVRRDMHDQMFLDLACSGNAAVLVTGDADLLALATQTPFIIETAEAYRRRMHRE